MRRSDVSGTAYRRLAVAVCTQASEDDLTRFRGAVAVAIPALDEAENLPEVLAAIPPVVCGLPTAVLVVDDGSEDETAAVASAAGALVLRHERSRGGGEALRTAFDALADAGALAIVTMDADGQHDPAQMARLVAPVLEQGAALAHGSRVLGSAERAALSRRLGVAFFNRLVSVLVRRPISDCSNGYRALRPEALRRLDLRQRRFHTAELLIAMLAAGEPVVEVPVTVRARRSGESKKPPAVPYGVGFARSIIETWVRTRSSNGRGPHRRSA
jgi:glycosyltransferase involved in cell wall biosynthesis